MSTSEERLRAAQLAGREQPDFTNDANGNPDVEASYANSAEVDSDYLAALASGEPPDELPEPPDEQSKALSRTMPVKHSSVADVEPCTGIVWPSWSDYPEFWRARSELDIVRNRALSRMVSPWAVLGHVLCSVLARIPPTVVLPALIGGPGSLNFILAVVAPSSGGKGASSATARDLVDWRGNVPKVLSNQPFGTGEGIVSSYVHREPVKTDKDGTTGGGLVHDNDSVAFTADEIDSLFAQANRKGATVMSVLRSAWMGEIIGSTTADPTRKLKVDAHRYRFTATLGVQPDRGHSLLNDSSGGTPQRFLWMPGTDRAITRHGRPDDPGKLEVCLPPWGDAVKSKSDGLNVVSVDGKVQLAILDNHVLNQRGEVGALDGHALLTREKLAYALAVLDGHWNLTVEDWDLAGAMMEVSDETRAMMKALSEQEHAKQRVEYLEARGKAQDEVDNNKLATMKNWIMGKVGSGCNRSQLRHTKPNKYRDLFDQAIAVLEYDGLVHVDAGTIYPGPSND